MAKSTLTSAVKIRELLNHRKTKEATKLARESIAAGNASPETQKLAALLLAGGRGRKALDSTGGSRSGTRIIGWRPMDCRGAIVCCNS